MGSAAATSHSLTRPTHAPPPHRTPAAGHQLGTIGSYLLCPLLIAHLGWESVFWIFGSLGFVWLLGWLPLVSDNPPAEGGAATPAAALAGAASSGSAATAAAASSAHEAEAHGHDLRLQDVPWASFARSKAFWAIVAAQCTVSVGNVLAFRCAGVVLVMVGCG